jgi:adenylyltransferase/sulfurtransferase
MPIISIIAALQVSEAIKLLTGQEAHLHHSLLQFDVWRNDWRRIKLEAPMAECPACGLGRYETLDADANELSGSLCGRDAVQIRPGRPTQVDLPALAERLRAAGEVQINPYLVRLRAGDYELTIFQDARAIIRGTDNVSTARSLYSKYVGN